MEGPLENRPPQKDNHGACVFSDLSETPAVKIPVGCISIIISLWQAKGKTLKLFSRRSSSATGPSTSYRSNILSVRYGRS